MQMRGLIGLSFLLAGACSTRPETLPRASMTWVISGQSNAVGYALGTPLPSLPRVLAWDPKSTAWLPAVDPLPFVRAPEPGPRVGPWAAAAQAVIRSGRVQTIRLTGAASGGLGIDEWAPDALQWTELASALTLSAQGAEVFLWFQGESDAVKGGHFIDSYEAKLTDLIRRVRRASASPAMLVIICGLVDYPPAEAAFERIRDAQKSVAASYPRATWVSTHGLPTDGQHLTAAGYLELGQTVARVILARGLGSPADQR